MKTVIAGRNRRRVAWAAVLIAITTVLVYLPVLTGFYLADDFAIYTGVRRGDGPLLSHVGYIRPLPILSMRMEFWLFGVETTPAHLVSLGLHLACAALVGLLAMRATRQAFVAFAAALLFSLHPIHPPAVSWLSARFDLMCTLFVLATLVAYDRHLESGGRWELVLSLACFTGALLCKEVAVCTPFLIVCVAIARDRRLRLRPFVPHALLLAAYFCLRFFLFGGIGGRMRGGASNELNTGVGAFLDGLFVQSPLALVFPVNELQWGGITLTAQAVLCVLLVLACGRGLSAQGRVLRRATLFGLALMLVAMLPTAIRAGRGFQDGLSNARFLYLPSAGFCIALGTMLGRAGGRGRSVMLVAFATVYAAVTVGNNLPWGRAAEISEAIPTEITRLYPSFGVEDPVVVVQGAPRFHRGAYLYLNRKSLQRAFRLLHPESATVVANRDGDWGVDLRALEPERVFAFEWQDTRGQLVDHTATVREHLAAFAPDPSSVSASAGEAFAGWTVDGAPPTIDDGALVVTPAPAGKGGVVESPALPRTTHYLQLRLSAARADRSPSARVAVTVQSRFDEHAWSEPTTIDLELDGNVLESRVVISLQTLEELDAEHLYARVHVRGVGLVRLLSIEPVTSLPGGRQ